MSYSRSFFVPGNIILMGEYYVLYGGDSLCVPAKYGQNFKVESGELSWQSYDVNQKSYFSKNIDLRKCGQKTFLEKLFFHAKKQIKRKYKITSVLTYPFEWGLGSSATSLVGFAKIFELDPFELFASTQSGSGYDVAVSFAGTPLQYKMGKPRLNWQVNEFLQDSLLFFPLGKKVDSNNEIKKHSGTKFDPKYSNELVQAFAKVESKDELNRIVKEYNQLLSQDLGMASLKDEKFSDYPGEIKYLGGWGGDLAMAVIDQDIEQTKNYLRSKGHLESFSYKEFVA